MVEPHKSFCVTQHHLRIYFLYIKTIFFILLCHVPYYTTFCLELSMCFLYLGTDSTYAGPGSPDFWNPYVVPNRILISYVQFCLMHNHLPKQCFVLGYIHLINCLYTSTPVQKCVVWLPPNLLNLLLCLIQVSTSCNLWIVNFL